MHSQECGSQRGPEYQQMEVKGTLARGWSAKGRGLEETGHAYQELASRH